jgi:PTS system nitrogen regulatory IIA component
MILSRHVFCRENSSFHTVHWTPGGPDYDNSPMFDEPFDIDTLAAYLHTTPQRISRLADRGKLPGRKVAGRWRFSPAEVHHWLENRIGASDEEELVEMEGVLSRSAEPGAEAPVVLAELLPREAIAVPLAARTKNSVITKMTELAAGTGLLWDAAQMAEAVRAREKMHPTALDIGVALLHPRRPMPSILGQSLLALGVTPSGIPFGGTRGGLTDVFLLICSENDQRHLRILARISRLIGDSAFLAALRAAPDAQAAHELIDEHESKLG